MAPTGRMNSADQTDRHALLKSAFIEIKNLRAALDGYTRAESEPIAVIGLGCRFPGGANDPDRFWALLREGRDAIQEVPRTRWDVDDYFDADPEAPAKTYARHGGFLDLDVRAFDAEFFK